MIIVYRCDSVKLSGCARDAGGRPIEERTLDIRSEGARLGKGTHNWSCRTRGWISRSMAGGPPTTPAGRQALRIHQGQRRPCRDGRPRLVRRPRSGNAARTAGDLAAAGRPGSIRVPLAVPRTEAAPHRIHRRGAHCARTARLKGRSPTANAQPFFVTRATASRNSRHVSWKSFARRATSPGCVAAMFSHSRGSASRS